MAHIDTEELLTSASELLSVAEHEHMRAEEDVVTHLICWNSRQSLVYYLTAFLQNANIVLVQPVSVESLLNQCKMVDARFETLNLSHMDCRSAPEVEDYCLDHDHVHKCMKSAQQARAIVMNSTPPY